MAATHSYDFLRKNVYTDSKYVNYLSNNLTESSSTKLGKGGAKVQQLRNRFPCKQCQHRKYSTSDPQFMLLKFQQSLKSLLSAKM